MSTGRNLHFRFCAHFTELSETSVSQCIWQWLFNMAFALIYTRGGFNCSSSDSLSRDPWLSLYTKGVDRNGPSTSNWLQSSRTKVQLFFKVLFGAIFGLQKTEDTMPFKEFTFHFQENKHHVFILTSRHDSIFEEIVPLEPNPLAIDAESNQCKELSIYSNSTSFLK